MSELIINSSMAGMIDTTFNPGRPGSPNYRGAKDYPDTIYPGYSGSQRYVWEPLSLGYPFLDLGRTPDPVAIYPFQNNKSTFIKIEDNMNAYDECYVPSFFIDKENIIERCTYNWSKKLFWISFIVNLIVSIFFLKQTSVIFWAGFILFHLFLYRLLTIYYKNTTVSEWNTIQVSKRMIKADPEYSKFDTPAQVFNTLTKWLIQQPINQQKILYVVLGLSFSFLWVPSFISSD
jgi:hypothetical protein